MCTVLTRRLNAGRSNAVARDIGFDNLAGATFSGINAGNCSAPFAAALCAAGQRAADVCVRVLDAYLAVVAGRARGRGLYERQQ